jgi:thiamine biosynthesis lipoprotein
MRLATAAMGTRFEIVLEAAGGRLAGPALRAAGEAAVDEIDEWHRRLNRFAADSLVSHLNRSQGRPVRLDRETFDLFDDALEVRRASAGAFDITAAPMLVRHGARDSAVPTGGCGESAGSVELDPATLTIRLIGMNISIDLGGIAKGHALDCAAARLCEAGVSSALLHGGTSSVLAIGRPAEQAAWRVALGTAPDADVVALENSSLSLSDPAGQIAVTGREHIVDPRAATPGSADRPRASSTRVAVIGPSARLADAWSTALAVIGDVPASFPDGYEARFLNHHVGGPAHAIATS